MDESTDEEGKDKELYDERKSSGYDDPRGPEQDRNIS
jgi:hypothetical protein